MRLPIDDSKISEEDKNPTVLLLLEIIKQRGELIQQLKDEIARLKGHHSRPNIRTRRLENNKSDNNNFRTRELRENNLIL